MCGSRSDAVQCNIQHGNDVEKETHGESTEPKPSANSIGRCWCVCVQCTLLILSTVKHCKIVWIIRSVYCPVHTVVRLFVRCNARNHRCLLWWRDFSFSHTITSSLLVKRWALSFIGSMVFFANPHPSRRFLLYLIHSLALAVETVSPSSHYKPSETERERRTTAFTWRARKFIKCMSRLHKNT